MICQHCKKNPATINFIETINGQSFELHLCKACYTYKYGEFEEQATNAVLNGLFGVPEVEAKTCKVCGMRFADYEKTGLVGCASCYDVFKDELLPAIARIQGKVVHVGKEGGDYSSEHDLRIKLKAMQEKLENALRSGNNMEASKLNAQMDVIRKKLSGRNGNG
jgi:protein arginine kinase activator